ncbi:glycoside hydrolase family 15 protein [Nocardia africana]|uniref:Trehalase n=1 Tax=Nocardia africana TaxID=134964 RepID=A0A378WY60_9NOCA|nr:glycoside hydrolase family 15 protein [Nocardia africana]MCC3312502.1 glycoside hydrolase family 15 protein [Nocardia africana]SUA46178.1 Trehalase [Nocardia africana]
MNDHPEHTPRVTAFPRIDDYAFISDSEVTALIAPSGAIEWMCLPRMDSPSVFGAILDRSAGTFRFAPDDIATPADRRYIPGTMVMETSWRSGEGWATVRDVLLVGPWRHQQPGRSAHRRAPTDYDAEHILLRIVHCETGQIQFVLDCQPAYEYGRARATWEYLDSYHLAQADADGVDLPLRLTTDLRLGIEGSRAVARTLLKSGDTRYCALSWGSRAAPETVEEARERLIGTVHHWRHWLAGGRFPDHPWSAQLTRSALTLKGLTFAPTGAIVAAPTTSLPETPGGERNWDYRYTWIRDSAFALWGLYTLGFNWEANDYFSHIINLAENAEDMQIVYGIGGETDLREHTLDNLRGYENATPVRVGNDAYRQRQHDVWGAALDSVYLYARHQDQIDARTWPLLRWAVKSALAVWREPDHGIWEVRGKPQHFTSSKVMCWVAADRGARLARIHQDFERAARWQRAADEIRADVCANAVDARGVFTQYYGSTALDASTLLIPLVRFLPADDERVRKTVLAIADELTSDGLVLRYRTDETDDGFTGAEGTFTICSFWLVSALSEIGEQHRAKQLCEKLLGYASPLGLYAEEIDPATGRHWGNYPQAFTHLALINAVMHVVRDEQIELRTALGGESIAPRLDDGMRTGGYIHF